MAEAVPDDGDALQHQFREDESENAAWPDASMNMMQQPSAWFATVCTDAQMLPSWNEMGENEENTCAILGFRTERSAEFQRGQCARQGGKGKGRCPYYAFESQSRRCPVDPMTGQLNYWDVPCETWNGDMGFCPNGPSCVFAHGRDEVSYHPAKYKTRLCNGHECRGKGVCAFAHNESELRHWAPERYSFFAVSAAATWGYSRSGGSKGCPEPNNRRQNGSSPYFSSPYQGAQQKHRFCATYPNVNLCRRGALCAFAHSREEANTPLLSVDEEEGKSSALTEEFFTQKFKTLWCPIGAQHDWQACPYAHTYQDARRKPSIGYGPQPCPYWGKKDTRAAYSQRCPLGLRCPYSHGAKEQLYHPNYFRTVICRDLQLRGCPRQHLCAFHHRRSERRSPGVDNLDYSKPLDKEAIPQDWAASFLAPPFFQETGGDAEEAAKKDGQVPALAFPTMMGPNCGGVFFSMGSPDVPQQSTGKEAFDEETPRTQSTVFESDLMVHADLSATSSRDTSQDETFNFQQQAQQADSQAWQLGSGCEEGNYSEVVSSLSANAEPWAGGSTSYGGQCWPCYTAQPAFFYNGVAGPGIAIPVQAVWWCPEQQQQEEAQDV